MRGHPLGYYSPVRRRRWRWAGAPVRGLPRGGAERWRGGVGQMASKLMRTPVGPEPTIFGLVFRRLAHQAKEALNAIGPPKALNATSAVWVSGVGLIGSSKAKPQTPPPRAPKRWRGAMGGRGGGVGWGGVGQMVPKVMCTPCGTRAHNLRIRGPTPCPLGQGDLDEGPSPRIL